MIIVRKMMMALVLLGIFAGTTVQADVLYLRDGWDPVNNVADISGYTGTKDDTSDHTVWSNTGTYAGRDELFFYKAGCGAGAIVDFDLSEFSSQLTGETINSATLVMTFSSAGWWAGSNVVVRECDQTWVEDETGYWKAGTTMWNDWTTGMPMIGPKIDDVWLGQYYNGGAGRTGEAISLDVTSVVAGWIEDGNVQKGFSVGDENYVTGNNAALAGKAYATVEYRPMLVIDYTPEPATMGLLGIGGFLVLIRKRRA